MNLYTFKILHYMCMYVNGEFIITENYTLLILYM